MTQLPPNGNPALGPSNRTLGIFLVSVAALFLELMLIRWIGTEIRIFAYLQNTVLVVCFLGLGMGCFTSRQEIDLRRSLIALLALTLLLAIPVTRRALASITTMFSVLSDLLIWQHAQQEGVLQTLLWVALGLGLTFGLMILLWEIFLPLGRILGRLMDDHPRTIWAYSVNVAGSLLGIGLFVLASAFYLPPVAWFIAAAIMLLFFLGTGQQRLVNAGLLAALVLAAWFAGRNPDAQQVVWSPYQKLELAAADEHAVRGNYRWPGESVILVNNAGYQGIIDLSELAVRENPDIPAERYGLSQYDIPLKFHPNPQKVLIVGAGSGNDVAGALRGGAESVTAVEIDPAIIEMGREHHPERPYQSDRVRIVNDDARSFFATTDEKYDLIIFGLLDSHTTTSMTNARLDHYVYTRESITRARELLAKGGVVALSFEAVKPYIADRMAGCIRQVFGAEPVVFRIPQDSLGWGGVMFVTGDAETIHTQLAEQPRLSGLIARWQEQSPIDLTYTTEIATDDWPYIYLETRRIPVLYLLLAVAMLALAVRCARRLKMPGLTAGWQRSHWHFFFPGAAFLLLEVQNISKASVVLGNTWVVNAVIISGILLMILLANVIAARFPKLPQDLTTFCLIGSCLALFFVDLSRFGFLPYATKAAIVGTLTTLPMLFSGIIFIRSFSAVERKDLALGANMYGALVGGLLQSVTFVVGIKALLLIVAGLYLAALLTRPKSVAELEQAGIAESSGSPDGSGTAESQSAGEESDEPEPELAEV